MIFVEEGKENIQVNLLDKLYSECEKLKFSDSDQSKLKILVRNGKKLAIKRLLISECGEKKGISLY